MVRKDMSYVIIHYSLFILKLDIYNVRMVPVKTLAVVDETVVTFPVYLASGTTQSCTAQGFIGNVSVTASVWYYTELMVLCEPIILSTPESMFFPVSSMLMNIDLINKFVSLTQ